MEGVDGGVDTREWTEGSGRKGVDGWGGRRDDSHNSLDGPSNAVALRARHLLRRIDSKETRGGVKSKI